MSIAIISPARILANQNNARKSSGPKTLEGKARSRANAVKHGLSGAGIALPTEDAAEVERRFTVLQDEMAASTVLGSILVKQVALMSVRLDRAAVQESAALSSRVRHAEDDFDRDRQAEVNRLFDEIDADPTHNHRQLLTFPEGVDRLVGAWQGVQRDLATRGPSGWDARLAARVEALFGHQPGFFPRSPIAILFDAISGPRPKRTHLGFVRARPDLSNRGKRARYGWR